MDRLVRPASPADVGAVGPLLLEPPGGLTLILGDRRPALVAARAAFLAPRSAMAWSRTLVSVVDGHVLGVAVRFAGGAWRTLRVWTGLAMLRALGPRLGLRLAWRGRVEERAMPPIPPDSLYLMSLAVDPAWRGQGVGSQLLRHVVDEAAAGGFRSVSLDVAEANQAVRLYRREGFAVVAAYPVGGPRDLRAATALRMERPLGQ